MSHTMLENKNKTKQKTTTLLSSNGFDSHDVMMWLIETKIIIWFINLFATLISTLFNFLLFVANIQCIMTKREYLTRAMTITYHFLAYFVRAGMLEIQDAVYIMGGKQRYMPNISTLRPRQNGRHFPDDIFKYIFLNENMWIFIEILLKFVPNGLINNIPALVQKMPWYRPGDNPLSEPMFTDAYMQHSASMS